MTTLLHRGTWIVASILLAAALATGAAAGGPTPFELVFDGVHVPLSTSPNGFGHAGTFTASGALCSAGKAADQRVSVAQQVSSTRRYTCDDGTGSFTVQVNNIPSEHVVDGTGTWHVVSGTSSYAKLRGDGTWTTVSVHGDESDLPHLTFTTKTEGTAFIDDVAPQAGFVRASARKRTSPASGYLITVAFFARDDAQSGASYRLKARIGSRTLASKAGQTGARTTSASLTIHPPKGSRTLRLQLTATDAVGNARTIERSLTLPT